jgi:hypothetical protein
MSMARAAALFALMGLVPAIALAQAPGASSAPPAPPVVAPGSAPAASGAPSASARPVVPATGYAWTPAKKKPRDRTSARPARTKAAASDAIMPGFETLADGSTRLFVQLTRPVAYDTKVARGTITYVLKGAHVDRRNNYNPLVTVHFNTPVTSARLVPHGQDLWFVVELRAPVQPTVAMDAAKDGGAMLRVEFAPGNYLPELAAPARP